MYVRYLLNNYYRLLYTINIQNGANAQLLVYYAVSVFGVGELCD